MASLNLVQSFLLVLFIVNLSCFCMASRVTRLNENEYTFPNNENPLTYHNGEVLQGQIPVTLVWYGKFTQTQKYIITNFIESLTHDPQPQPQPQQQQLCLSVSQWFDNINQLYLSQVENCQKPHIHLNNKEIVMEDCSMGKYLTLDQLSQIATTATTKKGEIALVFTAEDVSVEGFCMARCALHKSDTNTGTNLIWVGNAATQCPGQCAWPFHPPMQGPSCTPLVAPNGDTGVDGMIINLAHMIVGTITNPNGDGFYQGSEEEPLEASTACAGAYAKGHYPGYAGNLPTDSSGASYNANGANGQNYLLPAFFHPSTCSCTTMA